MKPSSRSFARFAVSALVSAILSCGLVSGVPESALAHGLHGIFVQPRAGGRLFERRARFNRPFPLPNHRRHNPDIIGHGSWVNIDLEPETGQAEACQAFLAGPRIIRIDKRPAPRTKVRVIYGLDPCAI